jgi:hypothetical protein
MKKDRMRELLTELCDKEISLELCTYLFSDIKDYLETRESKMMNDNPNLVGYWSQSLEVSEYRLQQTLSDLGLDYTLDEFITYD